MSIVARAAALAGLDPGAVGEDNLRRAAALAMHRLGLGQEAYLARLGSDPAERRALAGAAVVQETWLFRNRQAFAALGRLASTLPRPLRVLSAPCATGEEAASLAVTLLDAGISPGDFFVDAADANPQALAKARTGRFGPASLRGDTPASPHLRADGDDLVLSPRALDRIRFLEADILDEGFMAGEPPYQAVFCSNLLIYLSAGARVRLAANLSRLLAPEGALFTSPAEAPALAGLGLAPHDPHVVCPMAEAATTAGPEASAEGMAGPECPSPAGGGPAVQAPGVQAPGAGPPAMDDSLLRARELADIGSLSQALELVDSALAGGRADPGAYHLKGAIHLAMGEAGPAEQAFRRALYLDPGHLESLGHLELLARAEGREAEAGLLAGRAGRAGHPGGSAQPGVSGLSGEERP